MMMHYLEDMGICIDARPIPRVEKRHSVVDFILEQSR